MKKLLFLIVIVLMITGCSLSKGEIEKTVTTSMQEKFDNDENFKKYHLKVGDIEILKITKGKYSGFLDVYIEQEKYLVPVDINVDGQDVTWKTSNGAFLFLCQKKASELFN